MNKNKLHLLKSECCRLFSFNQTLESAMFLYIIIWQTIKPNLMKKYQYFKMTMFQILVQY